MNLNLWAIMTELSNALPQADVSLAATPLHYNFTIYRPDEGVTHSLVIDRPQFDALPLNHILGVIADNAILEAFELAPYAVEITIQGAAISVEQIRA